MSRKRAETVRVLHVEDDPDFAELAATFLERQDDRLAVETVGNASQALDEIERVRVDCVVSDYDMPGRNGIEFLEAAREIDPTLPFILYTGKGSEEVASDAISAGVTDYLQKEAGTDQYAVLANRITNAVEYDRSRRMVERSERRLRKIIDSVPHFLFVVDEDNRYLLANEALASFHGETVESVEGKHVADVIGDQLAEQFRSDAVNVIETGDPKHLPTVEIPADEGGTRTFEPRLLPYDLTDSEERAVLGIAVDVTEREARKGELTEKERRYRAMFHDPNILVGLLDPDGTVLDVNRTALEYVPDDVEMLGELFPETTWFDDDEDVRSTVETWIERAAAGEYVDFELSIDGPDAHRYDIAGVFKPVTDDDGKVVSIFVTSRDVSEQKRHERDLERTNTVLSTLFDTLPVGVIAEDEHRNVLSVNERLFDLFGIDGTPENVVGTDCRALAETVSELFADPAAFIEGIDAALADEDTRDAETLALRDGRTFARDHRRIDLADGDGHLWVYRDVSDRVQRERQLEALNEVSKELMTADTVDRIAEIGVEAANDILGLGASSIHRHDGDTGELVPVASTDTLRDLVGDPPAFAGGESIAWRSYVREEPLAVDDVRDDADVLNPNTPIRSELYLPLGEHGILIAGSTTVGAFDQQDVVLGSILAGNLATAIEQVRRNQQLRAHERELARQNESLESFASILSHDLRSPLNVASGQLELAMEKCANDRLPIVERSLDRMETLIEDLLTLAREGDQIGEMEPVDLAELCRGCWETLETDGATLVVDADRIVVADRTRLRQLIENLLRNAVEHGSANERSEGGADTDVTITVGELDTGFSVADDGTGIPVDRRETVFDAGYSTATRGTGLGLQIVKQIVDAHGWTVEIADSEDGGTRFEITDVDVVDR
jgi:PAS domain S-box-containing protein